jgi:hypothetical protein
MTKADLEKEDSDDEGDFDEPESPDGEVFGFVLSVTCWLYLIDEFEEGDSGEVLGEEEDDDDEEK